MTTVPTPTHYWKFDETTGTIAKDSTGGADITLDRNDCWVPGKFGNAVRFDPNGGVKSATAFQAETEEIPQPWTAALWVQRGDAGKPASLFASKHYALRLQQEGALDKAGFTFFGQYDTAFDFGVPLGQWTHLTMVGTATETKLYLNGEPVATLAKSINLGLHWLGSSDGFEDVAVALLDEVKVWNVALTDDQVKVVSNENPDPPATKPPPPPPPPPAWPPKLIFPLQGRWLMVPDPSMGPDHYYYDVRDTGDGYFTATGTNIRTGTNYGCPDVTGSYVSANMIKGDTWDGHLFAGNPDTIKWVFGTWSLDRPFAVWTRV